MSSLYESVDDATLTEIIREAEVRLEDQLAAGMAADQRALTFAGFLATAVAGALAIASSLKADDVVPAMMIATGFALAALIALWSARPTRWSFRGTSPSEWLPDIEAGLSLRASRSEMAAHYAAGLKRNHIAMMWAARAMKASLAITGCSLLAALIWVWWRVA